MCGIVGYVGRRKAAPLLTAALKKLEYRGYDSAGIATLNREFHVRKCTGSVSSLKGDIAGSCGIGHTRWATHGAPTEANAHPHLYGRFAVVHNGIIENFRTLKEECEARGETFSSETDSEVVAHLLERFYEGDLLTALRKTTALLKGSYALALLCRDEPDTIALAREKSPLIVGKGRGLWCASDVPALAAEDIRLYMLEDGEYALLRGEQVVFYSHDGEIIRKRSIMCDVDGDVPEKKGYPYFMRKEIAEIPKILEKSRPNSEKTADFAELYKVLCHAEYIQIAACGTAYHAGLAAKYAFEALARVPVEVDVASEYRYRDPIVRDGTLMLAVSQSGETADTLAAAELAKERGATVVAVVNARHSSLATLADFVLYTDAGREIAVAATKSFNAQLLVLYSLAATLAEAKGRRGYGDCLKELPARAEAAIEAGEKVRSWTAHFAQASSVYFVGRGADYVAALEGSLKLKEISYLPSEGYPAGELKHGTLALVERGTPVVAVLTSERLAEKTMNAVHEVYARGAKVFLITSLPEYADSKELTGSIVIPACGETFSPALSVIPLQLLAYYVSLARGADPDRPRNLAKSVTVE